MEDSRPPPDPELAKQIDAALRHPVSGFYKVFIGSELVKAIAEGRVLTTASFLGAQVERLPQWLLIAPYIEYDDEPTAKT